MTLKLAYDWAHGAEYMQCYDLVYLIPLRDMHGNLQNFLDAYLFPKHESYMRDDNIHPESIIWRYVSRNQTRVLFILDGYDELTDETRPYIEDLLIKQNLLPKCDVIVTSRPLPSDHHLRKALGQQLIINGFDDKLVKTFVNKFFTSFESEDVGKEHADAFLQLIHQSKPNECSEMAKCPLLCLLLCILYQEKEGNLPCTSTEIYVEIIKYLKQTALYRRSEKPGSSFDRELDECLEKFGKLCLSALINDKLTFTDTDLVDDVKMVVTVLGLLINTNPIAKSFTITEKHYQPLHKSFIEFMAAKHLSGQMTKASPVSVQKIVKILKNLSFDTLYMVLHYLVGLLGSEASVLLDALPEFDLKTIEILKLLKESGYTEENVGAVSRNIATRRELSLPEGDQSELSGWEMIIASDECEIETLRYQCQKKNKAQQLEFFKKLKENESIQTLEVSSIVNEDQTEISEDIEHFGEGVAKCFQMNKLKSLKLSLTYTPTIIDEDVFSTIPVAIDKQLRMCQPHSLTTLKLNLHLSSSQMRVMLNAIGRIPNLTSLELNKMGSTGDHLKELVEYLGRKKSLKSLAGEYAFSNYCNRSKKYLQKWFLPMSLVSKGS